MANSEDKKLAIDVIARIDKLEAAMSKAAATVTRQSSAMESRIQKLGKNISSSFASVGVAAAAGFAVFATIKDGLGSFEELSDSATKINNSLKVAGLSGDALNDTFEKLYAIAQKNNAPLEALTQTFSRISLNQKELGATGDSILAVVDNVGKALKISGSSAEEAAGPLLQLSQAFGSGTVHAEEFNSVVEGMPALAQAAAKGIKQANGSVAELKNLVNGQKLSSRALFDGIIAGAGDLDSKLQGANETIGQAFTNLGNALTKAVRNFDDSTGAATKFATAIDSIASSISNVDVSGLVSAINGAVDDLDKKLGDIGNSDVFKWLNGQLGATDAKGDIINVDATEANEKIAGTQRNIQLLQDQIKNEAKLGFDTTDAYQALADLRQELTKLQQQAANISPTVQSIQVGGAVQGPDIPLPETGPVPATRPAAAAASQVDINDPKYKPTGTKTGNGGSKVDQFERETKAISDRTATLNAETAAQAKINPLVEDYGYAVAKAKAQQDLMNAAQKAGKEITPALAAEIDKTAESYAQATAKSEQLAQAQDKIKQAADDALSTAKDTVSGIVDDLTSGTSAAQTFANALKKVGDAILNSALNGIFSQNSGIGGGLLSLLGMGGGSAAGLNASIGFTGANTTLGSFLGFANGGYTGPGGKNTPAGIVHAGEYVIPKSVVDKVGVGGIRAMLGGYADGGLVGGPKMPPVAPRSGGDAVHVTFAPNVDARGADAAAVARLEASMAKQQAEFSAKVVTVVRQAKKTRQPGL